MGFLRSSLLVICLGLVGIFSCHAIGRIGNNTFVNPDEGYTASIPRNFAIAFNRPDGGIGMRSIFPSSPNLTPNEIRAYDLKARYPELAGKNPQEIVKYFIEAKGNTKYEDVHWTQCGESILGVSSGLLISIATWGSGHGLLLVGNNTPEVGYSIQSMMQTLQIDPAKCEKK